LQRTSVAISLGAATAAHAQQSGLVNVDVSNLRADIAKDLNVNASQIPVSVQIPAAVAANVCGVDANDQVQRQLVAQK
jgi:hypothetical protein